MRKAKVFYDAGNFLKRGENALGWEQGTGKSAAVRIVEYFKSRAKQTGNFLFPGENVELAEVYWYDGAYSEDHYLYPRQAKAFAAISAVPEITLRLGKIAEERHPAKSYVVGKAEEVLKELGHEHEDFKPLFRQKLRDFKERKQKGVDVLLVADMLMGVATNFWIDATAWRGHGHVLVKEKRRNSPVKPAVPDITSPIHTIQKGKHIMITIRDINSVRAACNTPKRQGYKRLRHSRRLHYGSHRPRLSRLRAFFLGFCGPVFSAGDV